MKKKLISALCTAVACTALTVPSIAGAAATKVFVDGVSITSEQSAIIKKNRVLVPMRVIFTKLGAEVQWNESEKTITATKGDKKFTITIGSENAVTGGNTIVKLDVPPEAINGRTLVPARFVSEVLGASVNWDKKENAVHIISAPSASPTPSTP
ncbi:copper amine oxidase N-terminal domain-containing protein [Aneurinibacillus tyrosinisolvens]|uniref:copper amine oxidase N-terminal domain-containing protein n=1 Tax=Aneurinibacillus tyrosinisolvens TaxID=1443435 RepID=UPI00069A8886|nr:copper amine oxidase N-terminal domain-containing protein [Aneurinibacillus tyrosinisolvens]